MLAVLLNLAYPKVMTGYQTFRWSVGIKINVYAACSKNGVNKEKNQGMWCEKGGKIQFIPVVLNAAMNLIQNTTKISLVKSLCGFGMEPWRLRDAVSLCFSTEDTLLQIHYCGRLSRTILDCLSTTRSGVSKRCTLTSGIVFNILTDSILLQCDHFYVLFSLKHRPMELF